MHGGHYRQHRRCHWRDPPEVVVTMICRRRWPPCKCDSLPSVATVLYFILVRNTCQLKQTTILINKHLTNYFKTSRHGKCKQKKQTTESMVQGTVGRSSLKHRYTFTTVFDVWVTAETSQTMPTQYGWYIRHTRYRTDQRRVTLQQRVSELRIVARDTLHDVTHRQSKRRADWPIRWYGVMGG